MSAIEVIEPGPLATIQDFGRPGFAHLGVGRSGAADAGALALANRLVGNRRDAAAIEVTLGGLVLILRTAATLALTGATCAGPLGWGAAVSLPAGSTVWLGTPTDGLRSYLAVRGGIAAPRTLGSRSADLLSGLGPPPLRRHELLDIADEVAGEVSGAQASPAARRLQLRIFAGPRADWFTDAAHAALCTTRWTVGTDSNRIGLRLSGPRLERINTAELVTEATLRGALQVPPDGQPILLGPDGPVTGGYPVIAMIADEDIDCTGQLRPGDTIEFRR